MRNDIRSKNIVICFLFLAVLLPSVVFSSTAKTNPPKKSFHLPDDLFDKSVKKAERLLISNYLDYIVKTSEAVIELRNINKGINNFLSGNKFWRTLKLKNKNQQSTLVEANRLADFVLTDILPAEKRLEKRLSVIGTEFKQQIAIIENEKWISDGFMENVRKLERLCHLNTELWSAKKKMVLLVNTNLSLIFSNPANTSEGVKEEVKSRIDLNIKVVNGLMIIASVKHSLIQGFKNDYQKIESRYNQAVIVKAEHEISQIISLVTEIDKQTVALKNRNTPNASGHARILTEITGVLKNRITLLEKKAAAIRLNIGVDDNFFYIPSDAVESKQVNNFIASRRRVSEGFIKETARRCGRMWDISKLVYAIKNNLIDTQTRVEAFIETGQNFKDDDKEKLNTAADKQIEYLFAKLTAIENDLTEIVDISGNINFKQPQNIISDFQKPLDIIKINRILKKIISDPEIMLIHSAYLDFKLISMLKPLITDANKDSREINELQNLSLTRNDKLTQLASIMNEVKQTYHADAKLTEDLDRLDVEIIKKANEVYTADIAAIDRRLKALKSVSKGNYYNFLMGVREQLKRESVEIKQLSATIAIRDNQNPASRSCTECDMSQSRWFKRSAFNGLYPDILYKMARLHSLLPFYAEKKVNTDNVLEDAENLFSISAILSVPPVFYMRPDCIDITFRAGNRSVTIRGVGNFKKIHFNRINKNSSLGIKQLLLAGVNHLNILRIKTVSLAVIGDNGKLFISAGKMTYPPLCSLVSCFVEFCIKNKTYIETSKEIINPVYYVTYIKDSSADNNTTNKDNNSPGFKPLDAYLGSKVEIASGPVAIGLEYHLSASGLISSLGSGYGKIKNGAARQAGILNQNIKIANDIKDYYTSKIVQGGIKSGIVLGKIMHRAYEKGMDRLEQMVASVANSTAQIYDIGMQKVKDKINEQWHCIQNAWCILPQIIVPIIDPRIEIICSMDSLGNLRYGKWCGPGWSDGMVANANPCWSLPIGAEGGPRNELDAACRRHDWAYNSDNSGNSDKSNIELMADLILIDEMWQINLSELPMQAIMYRNCASLLFKLKIEWDKKSGHDANINAHAKQMKETSGNNT